MSRISVVVPNWNGAARLERLLDSLRNQTILKAAEILVVDNASGDNSTIVANAAGAGVIALDRNYGFAHAVNAGVEQAKGDAIAIVNNDVTLEPECLGRLDDALDAHSFAVPKIVMAQDRGRIDGTFDLTSCGFCSWRAGHGSNADLPVWNRGTVIQSAPMTAALFRRSVFETVGGLDELFGSYLEDVDFGLRCVQHGLTGWYEPLAVAAHEGSATLGAWRPATVRLIARNQTLLARKYRHAGGVWPVLSGQLGWGLLALKHHAAWAWIQGKIDGYLAPVPRFQMKTDLAQIAGALAGQEQSIRRLLNEAGMAETYWSAYFGISGSRRSA